MKDEDRVKVSISKFGSVTASLFYYTTWEFFVGANHAEDAESVIERIKEKYLNGSRVHKHLRKGFRKYRSEIREAIKDELRKWF